MKPDKRIGEKMMRIERRWLCKGHAKSASAHFKRVAARHARQDAKRQIRDAME